MEAEQDFIYSYHGNLQVWEVRESNHLHKCLKSRLTTDASV